MGCIALFGSGLALLIVATVTYRIAQNTNAMRVQMDALARARGVNATEYWRAQITGMKEAVVFPASNEGDALRQLLVKGIEPKDIVDLSPSNAQDGNPLDILSAYKKKGKR